MKSKKVLVIIGLCVLIVVGLVAGLAKAIELGNSERDGRGSSDGSSDDSSIVLFVIFIGASMTAINAKRQKDKAQQDQENGV